MGNGERAYIIDENLKEFWKNFEHICMLTVLR